MDAIEQLVDEHRTILSVLDALETWADRLALGADPADLARFVAFFREFADACHHAKEEDLLFADMVRHGFPSDSGPIAVMLGDHEDGRALVRALAEFQAAAGTWSDDDVRAIATHAHAFATLLRSHIHKEDHVLYPMARRYLSESVLESLADRFAQAEGRRVSPRRQAELLEIAADLAAPGGTGPVHAR